ncbi:MAG: ABC transporter ATP-binding protein [Planctomycetota bacterium]
MSSWIVARDLSRWYGAVVGLVDVSLDLEPGVVGLLGPNGAGKSTFLKLVAGEIRPSRGSIEVLGRDPFANRAHFAEMGFCPQQDALYGEMSGVAFVAFLLRLSGYSAREARDRAGRAMERVGLAGAMERQTRGYSRGMRQRTKIAQAIAHDPGFLVLDEPLTGLDPIARRGIVELLLHLAREGTSILVSSHVLHEVEELTRNVLLLHRGRVLAQGEVSEIRALLSRHPRKVEIRARDVRALARGVLDLPGVQSLRVSPDGASLAVETFDFEGFLSALPAAAARARAGIRSLETPDAGLEAIFDYLVA